MKTINLQFSSSISRLAGNAFGQEIYKTFVKDSINFSEKTRIVFPPTIEDLAISFVQGFTEEIFKHITKAQFSELIEIDASDKVKRKISEGIWF